MAFLGNYTHTDCSCLCVGLLQVAGVFGAIGRSAAVNVGAESRRAHAPVNHLLRRRTSAKVFLKKVVPATLSRALVSSTLIHKCM